MPITSSTVDIEAPQASGRRWITETHIDQLGIKYPFRYLANDGLDVNAVMTARAAQVAADLTAAEIAANIAQVIANGSMATIVLNYSTATQSHAALGFAYQSATRVEAIMIGDFLSSLTDAQLQSLFSMTAAQVTSLRTNKLTTAASAAATIRASAGE